MDLVSIIIPNYNREDLVIETVQNMLDQDYPNKEVIVVDDGSTDNSLKRLREFGNSITLLTQNNQGPGAARNHGFSSAKGKFIQFMDNDDLASQNKISSQVKKLQLNNADAVYSPWGKFDIQNHSMDLNGSILQGKEIPTSTMLSALLQGWSIVLQVFLFRKEFLDKIGTFKTEVNYLEDMDYFVRMILNGARVVFDNEPLVIYRNNSTNKLSNICDKHLIKSIAEVEYFDSFIRNIKTYCPEQFVNYQKLLSLRAGSIFYTFGDRQELLQPYPDFLSLKNNFPPKWFIKAMDMMLKWKGGIKQRLHGWRCSDFYNPQKLSESHKNLIRGLGYSTTIKN